jgi:hypothetical protein
MEQQQKEDTFDPLCPADDGYSDYRSKDQIQRSMLAQKKKRENGHGTEDKERISDEAIDGGGGRDEKLNVTCQWYYIDQSGNVQGPFSSDQMMGWNQAGFFPSDTLVKNGQDGQFVEMGLVDLTTGYYLKHDSMEEPEGDVHDSDVVEEGVEDRIAILKQSMMLKDDDEEEVDGVEDRIAVLKNNMEERTSGSGIEDRLAALKTNHQPEILLSTASSVENQDQEEPLAYPIEAPYPHDQEEPPAYPIEAPYPYDQEELPTYPIKASYNSNYEEPPAYPIEASCNDNYEEPPAYPVEAAYNYNQEEPPAYPIEASYNDNYEEPPAYPIEVSYDYNQEEPPAYPIDASYDYNQEEEETPAYPMIQPNEENFVPPYPIHTHDENDKDAIPYPTQVAYPITQEQQIYKQDQTSTTINYPYYNIPSATATVTNATPAHNNTKFQNPKSPPKAVYQGDKAVIGLIPSNVQVRRSGNGGAPATKKRTVKGIARMNHSSGQRMETKNVEKISNPIVLKDAEEKNGVSDDYEKFMEEINALDGP